MKNWIMTDPETRAVKRRYQADEPDQSVWLYCPPHAYHWEVPGEVELEWAKVDENDEVVLDLAAKLAAETVHQAAVWSGFRAQRNARLAQCDWTQLADSPLDSPKKAEWASYRQELRDLPENTTEPSNPSWPTEPSA
jgi:hypothetical protein